MAEYSNHVAMVTLLTDDSFLPGVQVLVFTFKKYHPNVEVVVLVTPDVTKTTKFILKRSGVKVRKVENIPMPKNPPNIDVERETNPNWSSCGLTKLRIWGLSEYERVIYIDADCAILSSLDYLFSLPLGTLGFAAAPDIFPPDCFNAGVLVVRPDSSVFQDMLSKAEHLQSYDGGDTGFLNAYYDKWFDAEKSNRLDFSYNAQRIMHWMTYSTSPGYWQALCRRGVKILHFSSSPKPWNLEGPKKKLGELEMTWWMLYNEMSS